MDGVVYTSLSIYSSLGKNLVKIFLMSRVWILKRMSEQSILLPHHKWYWRVDDDNSNWMKRLRSDWRLPLIQHAQNMSASTLKNKICERLYGVSLYQRTVTWPRWGSAYNHYKRIQRGDTNYHVAVAGRNDPSRYVAVEKTAVKPGKCLRFHFVLPYFSAGFHLWINLDGRVLNAKSRNISPSQENSQNESW